MGADIYNPVPAERFEMFDSVLSSLSLAPLHDGLVQWAIDGLLDASWWQIVACTLLLTHITIASVTIFLHRAVSYTHLTLPTICSV